MMSAVNAIAARFLARSVALVVVTGSFMGLLPSSHQEKESLSGFDYCFGYG
jgi:hypothetical protein